MPTRMSIPASRASVQSNLRVMTLPFRLTHLPNYCSRAKAETETEIVPVTDSKRLILLYFPDAKLGKKLKPIIHTYKLKICDLSHKFNIYLRNSHLFNKQLFQ